MEAADSASANVTFALGLWARRVLVESSLEKKPKENNKGEVS